MLFNTIVSSVKCIRTQHIQTVIRTQKYSNWVHRRPVAIVNEEIVLENVEAKPKPRKYVNENEEFLHPLKPILRRAHKHFNKAQPVRKIDNTLKEDGTLNVTKLAEDDKILTTLMMTLRSRKLRERNNYILLEGYRLISDAIQAGVKPEIIIFSKNLDIMKLPLPERGVKLYKVPYQTIQLWSNLTTTPGIIGIFKAPQSFEKDWTEQTIPLTIICDNVREPGNLGSILRAAAGVACERIILTKGCVDVWEPKVLRSAAGAHFRISISKSVGWEAVKSLISPTAKIFAADNNVTVELKKLSPPLIDKEAIDASCDDERLSANSAPFVDKSSDETDKKLVEDDVLDAHFETNEGSDVDWNELARQLPILPYYDVDYTSSEIVMIVGGETEGLSHESISLLRDTKGVRVNVPLTNGVESLNTGMALGIVAFEIRRQFAMKNKSAIK